MTLIQERLKEVLDYDPSIGVFVWKIRMGKSAKGKIAGCFNEDGYIQISVDKKRYYAHRLAFLWMTGEFPKHQADHRSTNRSDNSWENLRQASNMQNSWSCANRRSSRKSKYKGLWFWEKRKKWQVKIKYGDKKRTIGYFSSKEEAAIKYHGDFALLNFPQEALV